MEEKETFINDVLTATAFLVVGRRVKLFKKDGPISDLCLPQRRKKITQYLGHIWLQLGIYSEVRNCPQEVACMRCRGQREPGGEIHATSHRETCTTNQ